MKSRRISNFSNYSISNDGVVYSHKKKRILKPYLGNTGYFRYNLVNDQGTTKTIFLHRLLAITYLPNPNNYPVVNHIDECKTNNRLDNLEWCTHGHNVRHSVAKLDDIHFITYYTCRNYFSLEYIASSMDIDGSVLFRAVKSQETYKPSIKYFKSMGIVY